MNYFIKISSILSFLLIFSCAENINYKLNKKNDRTLYSSSGFVLIYNKKLYNDGVVNKKINSDKSSVLHSSLKKNTTIKIVNPVTNRTLQKKITGNLKYPKIFSLVISKDIAKELKLDPENPFVEIYEVKKNKTFIAKEGNIFDEEKIVAEKAPVDDIKMDDISTNPTKNTESKKKKKKFILVISEFYFLESAENLMKELSISTQLKNLRIKKINENKYRLFMGPFKNFNSLKNSYISLNNLSFEGLYIYTE